MHGETIMFKSVVGCELMTLLGQIENRCDEFMRFISQFGKIKISNGGMYFSIFK